MPRFVVDGLENHQIPNTAFQFSGVGIKKLLSARYTVVQLVCDASPSVEDFMADEEACLKRALRACKLSPAKDNALMRTTVFAQQVKEIHGFVPLMEVDESGYDNILQGQGGSTALFAATEEGVRAAMTYADSLVDKDYDINGLVIVITDGMNNEPPHGCDRVHDAFQEWVRKEKLGKLTSVLVGVNIQSPQVSQALQDFKDKAGFTAYEEITNTGEKHFAHLCDIISKSVSSVSQNLQNPQQPVSLQF